MVNTDLPASTPRGRRAESAFRVATRRVIARDGFGSATVAAIATEATRLAGPAASWFDDGSHVPAVVAEHLRSALEGASSPASLVAAWWDACAPAPAAIAALVLLAPEQWRPVRDLVAGSLGGGVAGRTRADALATVSLLWLGSDDTPPRDDAVAALCALCAPPP